MIIDQISIFVENKTGKLCDVMGFLGEHNINIRAFSMADTTDFGILRLIVDNPTQAEKLLRDAGKTVHKTQVLAVAMDDKPGALHGVLKLLQEHGMSVEYAYAFTTAQAGSAYVILRVEDNLGAASVLEKGGVRLLHPDEVYAV